MRKNRILVVDDNEDITHIVSLLLEEQDYVVRTARNGAEGFAEWLHPLNVLTEAAYDLVITDYEMPAMNGLALVKRIRELDKKVPIILMSGLSIDINKKLYQPLKLLYKPEGIKNIVQEVRQYSW